MASRISIDDPGWILPKPSDNAINLARAGYRVQAIAMQLRRSVADVEAILDLAFEHGHLTSGEALLAGVDIPAAKAVA